MDENRGFMRVGSYSTPQAYPEDCIKCKNAKYGTILIDKICLDCVLKKLQHYQDSSVGLWCTNLPEAIPADKKHLFFQLKL